LEIKNLKIEGVELDPEVTRAAEQFFNLAEQKNLEVVNMDGRIYLQSTKNKYDLIFIDAYIGSLYVPFQLTTKEFFDLAKSRLKDEGILAMMVLSQNPQKERAFQGISQSIKSVFSNVYFFPTKSRGEFFIVSSRFPLEEKLFNLEEKTDILEIKEISADISQNFQEARELREDYILTDKRAPIEMLREFDKIFFLFSGLE